jgi:hypothetical protein
MEIQVFLILSLLICGFGCGVKGDPVAIFPEIPTPHFKKKDSPPEKDKVNQNEEQKKNSADTP